MRHLLYLLVLSLLAGSLAACMGGKTKPSPAIYDFGLTPVIQTTAAPETKVQIDEVTAAESLNSNRIRYRLNYQNPARVFSYTESRWAALPTELLSAKIRASSKTILSNQANCSLKLQLEAFDHVFDSETASHGVIQLSVSLNDKKAQKIIASQQIEESAAASTPDAKGGVAALNQASTTAIAKALDWGNAMAEKSTACH
jgi:cholesterol transport system auxiliary component